MVSSVTWPSSSDVRVVIGGMTTRLRISTDPIRLGVNRTFIRRRSASPNRSDHEGTNTAVDGAAPKPLRQGLGGMCRRVLETRGVTRLDFIPQRSSLAIGDRRIARRGGPAAGIHRIDRHVREPGGAQLLANALHVMVTVRRARHEAGRILRKQFRERL